MPLEHIGQDFIEVFTLLRKLDPDRAFIVHRPLLLNIPVLAHFLDVVRHVGAEIIPAQRKLPHGHFVMPDIIQNHALDVVDILNPLTVQLHLNDIEEKAVQPLYQLDGFVICCIHEKKLLEKRNLNKIWTRLTVSPWLVKPFVSLSTFPGFLIKPDAMSTKKPTELLKQTPTPFVIPQTIPESRLRRLRRSESLRAMVRETHVTTDDLIYPIFVEEDAQERSPLKTMPGIFRETEKTLKKAVIEAAGNKIRAVILFGVSHHKDSSGSDSLHPHGLLARMIAEAKAASPETTVIADVCFCEYTDHGHCGVLDHHHDVDNDRTIRNIALQAVTAAQAGADMIAPSGMMDGQVAAIRAALDANGFSHIPIMAYAAKFASAFYGPFRDAAGCALGKGNRKTYQMDPANAREALRESALDEYEGADILMVKPGLAYLDILARLREQTELPLAAYQVSGEYAMLKYAAQAGAINYNDIMMESLLAFKRAGADLILSYCALDAAKILNETA